MERKHVDCKNLNSDSCNPWVKEKFRQFKVKKEGESVEYRDSAELEKANKICAECVSFEPRP